MANFKEIKTTELQGNPFQMIGKDWMLVTAKYGDKVNTMTASWGGVGVLWGADVVYLFIRKTRYTKEFIDASDSFSLTFYDENQRKNLSYLGTVSGRDEDKIAKVGYHVELDNDIPYFAEAKTVLLCKKMSKHPITMEGLIDPEIFPKWYTGEANGENYHDMYVGKIEKVLVAED